MQNFKARMVWDQPGVRNGQKDCQCKCCRPPDYVFFLHIALFRIWYTAIQTNKHFASCQIELQAKILFQRRN